MWQADRGFAAQCFWWLIKYEGHREILLVACGHFLLNIVGSGSHVTQFFSIRDPSQAVYFIWHVGMYFRMPVSSCWNRGEKPGSRSHCSKWKRVRWDRDAGFIMQFKSWNWKKVPECRFHFMISEIRTGVKNFCSHVVCRCIDENTDWCYFLIAKETWLFIICIIINNNVETKSCSCNSWPNVS